VEKLWNTLSLLEVRYKLVPIVENSKVVELYLKTKKV